FGLRLEDIRIVRSRGVIAGVMALWDQTAYKQTIVRGYTGWMKWLSPLLPRVGAEVRSAYASLVCMGNDDRSIFDDLFRDTYNRARLRGFDYLLIGLDARDPLLSVAQKYPHFSYPSRLYL